MADDGNSSSEDLLSENGPDNLSDGGSCSLDDDGDGDDGGESGLGKRGRKENGLVTLTLRFIRLLKRAPNQTLDLNVAVE